MKKKMLLASMMLISVFAIQAQMRIHMINVGQGSATLVEFPCAAILVDAGGESNEFFNSREALKTYLDEFFERRPDLNNTFAAVYLTHPHKDHTYGVPVILEHYKFKNAITDGLENGSGRSGQIKLHRASQDADATPSTSDDIGLEAVNTGEINSGGFTNPIIDPINNCDGINPSIKVLWGASITKPSTWSQHDFNNGNNHSLVIKIQYGSSSILFIGDLEDKAQTNLIAKHSGNALDADVYVVGHHGSKNGTTQSLLNKVTPKIALIGCGDPDRMESWTAWAYGHPNKGILDILQAKLTSTRPSIQVDAGNGAKNFMDYTVTKAIYSTGWDGDVILEADAAGNWRKIESGLVPDLINLNTASITDLETLPGIGEKKAKDIVDFRTSNGNFATVEALDDVPGIGPATINLIKPYVRI